MIMRLFHNMTDKRYLNKNITLLDTLSNVYLKDETEKVNPTILLDDVPTGCNYCELPTFGRFYYLTGVTYENGLYRTDWHVDVLMSFREDIVKSSVIIERNTNDYDTYLQDNELKVEQYTIDQYDTFDDTPFNINNVTYVLGMLGG